MATFLGFYSWKSELPPIAHIYCQTQWFPNPAYKNLG